MPTIGTDLKTQPLTTPPRPANSTPKSKKKKTPKASTLDQKAGFDKENATVSKGDLRDQIQKPTPSSEKRKQQPLTILHSPTEGKVVGLFSPGAGSPTYKIVRRMEDKDKVKVGFVVANGPIVGMHVVRVTPRLPADFAGLQVGDIINVIGGHQTLKVEDFRAIASQFRPGDVIPLKITREVDAVPQNLHLLMRLPKTREAPLGPSPQKEMAKQVKLELAKMKEEKDRQEREALEKIKKEKAKIAAEKKAKEDKMREELEKRKAAAKLKRIEMKKRQEQLKNEEVLLLQELRARRAARKADLQAQAELTEKQKLEELAKVQEDEKKWAQVLKDEEKQRFLSEKKKHEEIKIAKEEKQKKREEREKIRKEQERFKEIERKKQEEALAKDKERQLQEIARRQEELRKLRELEQRKKEEGDEKKEFKTPSSSKSLASPQVFSQNRTPLRNKLLSSASKSPYDRSGSPSLAKPLTKSNNPGEDVRAMIIASQIPGLDKNDLIVKSPLDKKQTEGKEPGKVEVKEIKKPGPAVNGGKKRLVPKKVTLSKTLPLPIKVTQSTSALPTTPIPPKPSGTTQGPPIKPISKPITSKKPKTTARAGTLPNPLTRRASDTTPVRKSTTESAVGKRTVTVPELKSSTVQSAPSAPNGSKSPEPITKPGLKQPPGLLLRPNSSNGPAPIKLKGGGKKKEGDKNSPSNSTESSQSSRSVSQPVITIPPQIQSSVGPTESSTISSSSSTTIPIPRDVASPDSSRPEERNVPPTSFDGKDTIPNGPTSSIVQESSVSSPIKLLSTVPSAQPSQPHSQPPSQPPSQPSSVPVSPLPTSNPSTTSTPGPEVTNKRKSKIVVPPGKGIVLQKLRQNMSAVMNSESGK